MVVISPKISKPHRAGCWTGNIVRFQCRQLWATNATMAISTRKFTDQRNGRIVRIDRLRTWRWLVPLPGYQGRLLAAITTLRSHPDNQRISGKNCSTSRRDSWQISETCIAPAARVEPGLGVSWLALCCSLTTLIRSDSFGSQTSWQRRYSVIAGFIHHSADSADRHQHYSV